MRPVLHGATFINELLRLGIIDNMCQKVIIEADADNYVRIHIQKIGDTSLLEIVPALASAAEVGGR